MSIIGLEEQSDGNANVKKFFASLTGSPTAKTVQLRFSTWSRNFWALIQLLCSVVG